MMKITIEIETPVSEKVLSNLAAALGGAPATTEAPAAEPVKAPKTPKSTKAKKSEATKETAPLPIETTPSAAEPESSKATEATKEESEVTYTLEQVRGKLANLSRSGKQAEVKALLGEFGANKLSEVKEEDYAALMKRAEEL